MKTKKLALLLMLCLVVTTAFVGCASNEETVEAIFNAGTYEGTGEGHGGPITVKVTVNETTIESIEIVESSESDFSTDPMNKLIDSVLESNTGDVDTISGATESTTGVLTAINDALAKAYIDPANTGAAAVETEEETEAVALEDITTDVVVVGAGGAGLTAALEAHEAGADVIILEKMPVVGGNTNYATGGLNAAETSVQAGLGIEDSVELYFNDTMKGGKELNNPELVKVLTGNSSETVEWLIGLGADLTDVGRLGGASANRAHRPTGGAPVGNHLVTVLKDNVVNAGIEIKTENEVVEILAEDGVVTGVRVNTPDGEYNVYAKSVVMATGGFGANNALVASYNANLEGFGTTNHPGATGDAIALVETLDVSMIDMEQIQTHPTVIPEKNKMITEAVRGNGAILVNRSAERFISELETRDVVSAAELEQEGETAYLLFDTNVRESLSAIEKYYNAGLLTEAATLEELAEMISIDATTLVNTVDTYNGYVVVGEDADFGRVDLPVELNKGPYFAVEVGPAVHHTMGGVEINTDAQVINNSGEPVPGLYAAGEVTGGVHGGNRLGGNALSDITTFGRIAGTNAAIHAAE